MTPRSPLLAGWIVILFGTLACSDSNPPQVIIEPPITVVSVENGTTERFVSTMLSGPQDLVDYGVVEAGEITEAALWNRPYSYAAVEVELESGEMFRIQPFDFVGEDPLMGGRYTYVLTFDDLVQPSTLILTLRDEN